MRLSGKMLLKNSSQVMSGENSLKEELVRNHAWLETCSEVLVLRLPLWVWWHLMRQVPLERDINIAVNGCSGFSTSTQKGPFMAMLISRSRGTCLVEVHQQWEQEQDCYGEGGRDDVRRPEGKWQQLFPCLSLSVMWLRVTMQGRSKLLGSASLCIYESWNPERILVKS